MRGVCGCILFIVIFNLAGPVKTDLPINEVIYEKPASRKEISTRKWKYVDDLAIGVAHKPEEMLLRAPPLQIGGGGADTKNIGTQGSVILIPT